MKKVTGRRFFAYVIDYLIIVFISSLFSRLSIINPNYSEYLEKYKEYMTKVTTVEENISLEEMSTLTYDMSKAGVNISIINLVVSTLYFVGFQYINKGKTIGKRLFKLKIVDENNERPKFYQILIHSAVINSLVISLFTISAIILFNKNTYLTVNQILQLIDIGIIFLSLGLMVFRKDGKGLQNILSKTNVVLEE